MATLLSGRMEEGLMATAVSSCAIKVTISLDNPGEVSNTGKIRMDICLTSETTSECSPDTAVHSVP